MHSPTPRGSIDFWLKLQRHDSSMSRGKLIKEEAIFTSHSFAFDFLFQHLTAQDAKLILQEQKSTAWEEEYSSVNISSSSQGPAIKLSISPARHDVQLQQCAKPQSASLGIFSPVTRWKELW